MKRYKVAGGLSIFSGIVGSAFYRMTDAVLPPRCVITGEYVDYQGMLSGSVWARLDFITEPFCRRCGLPFDFEVEQAGQCLSCLNEGKSKGKSGFSLSRSAVKYNDMSRELILAYKHADKLHLVETFVPWLEKAGEEFIKDAQFLIPVPLHRLRLLLRRYNQSALLALGLSDKVGVPALPMAMDRVRATASQGHLSARERLKNVKNAFRVNPKYKDRIRGKTVILIDDVYTTGATVKECSRELLKSGAAKVHVLTLARVVREGVNG